MSRKIITTEETEEDKKIEGTLRPQYLKDYIGQEKIIHAEDLYHRCGETARALDKYCFTARRALEDNNLRNHRERDGYQT